MGFVLISNFLFFPASFLDATLHVWVKLSCIKKIYNYLTQVYKIAIEREGVCCKCPCSDINDRGEGAYPHHGQTVSQGDPPTQICGGRKCVSDETLYKSIHKGNKEGKKLI